MKPLHRKRNWSAEDSVGWMFMGEHGGPCDKSCEMCYYAHQKNLVFYDLNTMILMANMFKHYYGLNAADITGGEPTIYKHIVPLVQHCKNIGLSPRIITHGQNIRDDWKLGGKVPLYKAIEEAGLELWRVSLHGNSAESHDHVLGSKGSFDRVMANLPNIGVETQFNTTLLDTNYKDLPVEVLKDREPTVWNMIYFLPYFYWSDQTGETEAAFQVQYREAAPYVARAIETMEANGWEVNMRYWPLCVAKEFGFEANVSGYHQVAFDPWEWRLGVTGRSTMESVNKDGGWYQHERRLAEEWMSDRRNSACTGCSLDMICDKPPGQYQKKYGVSELKPVAGPMIHDPLHFQKTRVIHGTRRSVGDGDEPAEEQAVQVG